MFELRLSNFIVFRDYKLYDLIVPKLQESYCDFHGITVDGKRPHDKEIREHMWTYLNMKNETNIVLIGMSDYAFPSTRMISFDWLLFNDLVKPGKIAHEQQFAKLNVDIPRLSTLCAWWFNYDKFKILRYKNFEADNAINFLEPVDTDHYLDKETKTLIYLYPVPNTARDEISYKANVLFDTKLNYTITYIFESNNLTDKQAYKGELTADRGPMVGCKAIIGKDKQIAYCAGYVKDKLLVIHYCNIAKPYRGLGIQDRMEKILFKHTEEDGATRIL